MIYRILIRNNLNDEILFDSGKIFDQIELYSRLTELMSPTLFGDTKYTILIEQLLN